MSESIPAEEPRPSAGNVTDKGFVAALRASLHDVVTNNGFDSLLKEPPQKNDGKANVKELVRRGVTFLESSPDTKGDESIDRTISEDDDSDIDDVPEALSPDVVTVAKEGRLQTIAHSTDLAAFFESMQYRTISLIFGPMACFFFISYVVLFCDIFHST